MASGVMVFSSAADSGATFHFYPLPANGPQVDRAVRLQLPPGRRVRGLFRCLAPGPWPRAKKSDPTGEDSGRAVVCLIWS